MVEAVLQSALVRGALAGFIAAAVVDFQAFKSWKSFEEARRYNWPLALWRWFQGAVIGAVAGGSLTVSF